MKPKGINECVVEWQKNNLDKVITHYVPVFEKEDTIRIYFKNKEDKEDKEESVEVSYAEFKLEV